MLTGRLRRGHLAVVAETRPRVATLAEEPRPAGAPNTQACPSKPLPACLEQQVWRENRWPAGDRPGDRGKPHPCSPPLVPWPLAATTPPPADLSPALPAPNYQSLFWDCSYLERGSQGVGRRSTRSRPHQGQGRMGVWTPWQLASLPCPCSPQCSCGEGKEGTHLPRWGLC